MPFLMLKTWTVDWTLDSIMDLIIGLEFQSLGIKGHMCMYISWQQSFEYLSSVGCRICNKSAHSHYTDWNIDAVIVGYLSAAVFGDATLLW